mmetsp:Transcript_21504/g.57439  ORF Transcript_21504/g.57439 Transcript_21504/m.57439 type:complete len:239 (+) Transcript_21504:409-1125(+)
MRAPFFGTIAQYTSDSYLGSGRENARASTTDGCAFIALSMSWRLTLVDLVTIEGSGTGSALSSRMMVSFCGGGFFAICSARRAAAVAARAASVALARADMAAPEVLSAASTVRWDAATAVLVLLVDSSAEAAAAMTAESISSMLTSMRTGAEAAARAAPRLAVASCWARRLASSVMRICSLRASISAACWTSIFSCSSLCCASISRSLAIMRPSVAATAPLASVAMVSVSLFLSFKSS